MKPGKVRAIAVCIVRNQDSIFVFEGRDEKKHESFYRPLGGTIEFGEHSTDTAQREMTEEVGSEIANISFLGVLESIFRYEGEPGHEIVLVYEADFAEQRFYENREFTGHEDDGTPFKAVWRPIDFFRDSNAPLYPEGLLQLLIDRWGLEGSAEIAACGLDCGSCPIRKLPFDAEAAAEVVAWFKKEGWLKEGEGVAEAFERSMYCKGCHGDRSVHWGADCWILKCCVDDRGLGNCSECDTFPCDRLVEWSTQRAAYGKALERLRAMAL